MWRQYVNRVIFALLFMQLLMCLTIALQTQYLKAIIAAPPIVALAIFKWYTNRAFSQKFRWYLPDNEEVATLPLFGSEDPMEAKTSEVNKAASKLAKRFGHPSLHQQLLRPYVYKSQESALATILGDVEVTKSNEKKGTEAIVAGGIKFTAFDDHAPDLTQEEYLRRQKQEDDWETGSIASTAVSSVGGAVAQENDYFNSRSRAAYMQRGPSALSGQPIESPYMSHDLTPDSIQSRECVSLSTISSKQMLT